jgi:MFS family permease
MEASASLWHDADFLKLWAARTAATLGTLMGAVQLTAILVVDARAYEVALLGALSSAPGLALGLFAGVWVDRVRRRPVLIAADVTRAALLASIPAAYFADFLTIYQLYAVGFGISALRAFFEVGHHSYLPSVVGAARLVEANSKISASNSVVEVMAFSVAGWIAQLASAIVTAFVDSAMFMVSGMLLLTIRKRELRRPVAADRNARSELLEGLRHTWGVPVLRAILLSQVTLGLGSGVIGGMITLFGIREVGFGAGELGSIYAIGGISSLVGAVAATRFTRWIGTGPAMVVGLTACGASALLIPLATGPLYVAAVFLIIPQLTDGFWTVHDIAELSLRQAITPDRLRGRVNSVMVTASLGGTVLGSLLAGAIVGTVGLRWTLGAGAFLVVAAGLIYLFSPVRRIRNTR